MSEKLHFKLGLSGTYWGTKVPQYEVLVDDTVVASGKIKSPTNQIDVIEFDHELATTQAHELKIRLTNKEPSDTVQNEDKTEIIKDLLLNIETIEIDNIELNTLKWEAGKFVLDEPMEYNGEVFTELRNCVNLGMNGSYILSFTSPFRHWLLETI